MVGCHVSLNERIVAELFSYADDSYKAFQCALMPTVSADSVIGVRTPLLRTMAKRLHSQSEEEAFLASLPHKFYEENNLHAFLIEEIRDFDRCIDSLNVFLPYVDNWATCDMMRPKCFVGRGDELLGEIQKWLSTDRTYTLRFGIEMLMVHFLDDRFEPRFAEWVATIQSDEYYVNMMQAWYFATALCKQYDCAVKYLEQKQLSEWVHRKTIRKAIESYRIADDRKAYIKGLALKKKI